MVYRLFKGLDVVEYGGTARLMDHLYTNIILLVAGLCAISGLFHWVKAPPGPTRRVHRLFAGLSFLTFLQLLALAQTFRAANQGDCLAALRGNLSFVLLTLLALVWFFAEYTQVKPRLVMALLTGMTAVLFLGNLLLPATLQYREIHGIQFLTLPWGENLSTLQGLPGNWTTFGAADILLGIGFCLVALVLAYRRDHRRSYLGMIAGMTFLSAGYVQGILVRTGMIQSVPISPFCFLALLVIMGFELRMGSTAKRAETKEVSSGRNLLMVFFLLSFGILMLGAYVFRAVERNFRAEIDRQLLSISDLRVRDLVLWRKERLGDGNILFQNPTITALVGDFLKKPGNPSARKQLLMWFGKEEKCYFYEGVWLLDAKGVTRLTSVPGNKPASSVISKRVPEVLRRGQVEFQDLYRNEWDQKIYMDVLVPLFAPADHKPLAVIEMRIDPDNYLYPNLREWPGNTESGETGLFRQEGDEAVLLSESRFQKGTALTRRAPMSRTELPAVQALLGKEGIVDAIGYQTVPVVAALRKVPDSPWVLVVRMNTAELYAPLRSRIGEIIAGMLLLLFAAGAGVGLVWRGQRARYYKEKAESDAKYRQIFENIQDVFFKVDTGGKIVEASPSVKDFIGYTREEVIGKGISELYWDPSDRAHFVKAVGEKGGVTGYEVRFKGRSGGMIYASVNARQVRDEEGKPAGIEGLLRDTTAQVKARETQRLLAYILEQTNEAVVVADLELNIIQWNKGAEKIFGYTAQEILGKPGRLLDADEGPESVASKRDALREKGTPLQYEAVRKAKNGRLIHMDISSTPLKDESGSIIGYSAIYRDITERIKAQESLRLLANILEQTSDAVVATDMEEKIIEWNQGAERMFGFTAPEVLGRSMDFLVPDDLLEESNRGRQSFKSGQEIQLFRTSRKKKDGTLLQVDIKGGPLRDNAGKVIGISLIYRDVTEQLKAQENQRLLASILEQTPDGVILSDLENITRQWNKGAERILGYTAEEIIGKPGSMLEPPDQKGRIDQSSRELLSGNDSLSYERVLIRKDGQPVDVAVTRFGIKDNQGKIVGFAGIVRDITERKRIETALEVYQDHLEEMVETRTIELERATKAAEAANQAKSSFLANMSHEIRTPMNAILGFAQLLRRDPALTAQQDQQVDVILKSGSHLLTLINEILDYSKIEADRLTVETADFDLHALLEELDSIFKARAKEKGLRFLLDRRDLLPRFVRGDETKIRQILQNLLSNAFKFTEKGGVAMRVAVQPGTDGDGSHRLVVEVEDSGPGIAPEEMGKLFKVFEQTESGRKAKSGTGLGLAISRKFAELMGGTLEAESRVGRGSNFRLVLPVREGTDKGNAPQRRRVEGLEAGQPLWRVLVVDDNAENRSYLETLLTMVGFEVRSVVDGEQGLREFEAFRPQLILMDLRMPVMEGPEAIRRIRSMEGGDKVKIIAISASSFKEDQKKALKVGADEFISKPFREETLFERIENLLGVKFRWAEETEPAVPGGPEPLPENLEKERVARLPADLRAQLRQALLVADLDAALAVLNKIAQHDAGAAASLRGLAGKFNYQRIIELLGAEGEAT